MAHVMGIAVVDGQIASVVRDDADTVIATNSVDLPDESPATVSATIIDLVSSAPFEVSRIGLVAADADLVASLRRTFAPDPSRPQWYSTVTVEALDSAMAELALTDPSLAADHTPTGSIAVVNLDEYTAPTSGIPIIAVDSQSGAITGRSSWHPGQDEPTAVIDPSGAANVAGAVSSIPGSDDITHVVFTGTGADIPGVHTAFEEALGRPVVVAAQPRFAIAGAAAGLASGGHPAVSPSVRAAGPSAAYGASAVFADRPTEVVPAVGNGGAGGYGGGYGGGGYGGGDGGDDDGPEDRRNRRRWWLIGGTAAAGFLILGGAIAAVLFSTGTAQRVVGVTTISVTTETATVTRTETQTNNTVRTTTVTPPTQTRTVTRTTTRAPSTVTETTTVTEEADPEAEPGAGYEGEDDGY